MALADDVADLLRRSLFAHKAALTLRLRRLNGPPTPLALLVTAFLLRVQANTLDPGFTAPAWETEKKAFYSGINEALIAFYQQHIP